MVSTTLKLQKTLKESRCLMLLGPSKLSLAHIFYGNLVKFILKFKISMAFTLYKLSLKLLSSVADQEFKKRGARTRFKKISL